MSERAGLPRLALDPWTNISPSDCAQLEDLDGDGFTDLVFLWDGGLQIGWGHGDLTFDYELLPMDGGTAGCLVVDLDGDGARDVILPRHGRGSAWLRQTAPRVLEDVSAAAGIADVPNAGRGAAAFDFDRDGDLDLFVGGRAEPYPPWTCRDLDGDHVHCDAAVLLASPDHLFEQQSGVFVDRSASLGIDGSVGSALAAATFDVDDDGDLDLLVGNDFGVNELYVRGVDGLTTGTSARGLDTYNHAMGIGLLDYDLDGALDFFVSEVGADMLFHREGDRFVDRSGEAFVAGPTADHYAWGIAIADYDGDGDEDVFAATNYVARDDRLIEMLNGIPAGAGGQGSHDEAAALVVGAYAGAQGDDLFVNCGDGTFEHQSLATMRNPGLFVSERPASTADVDGDGRMDVFVVGEATGPRLLHNVTMGGHTIELVLRGGAEPEAIGALVEVTSGGRTQRRLRQIGSAGGHPGSVLHVGIGASTTADVVVRWPDGATTERTAVAAGSGVVVTHP